MSSARTCRCGAPLAAEYPAEICSSCLWQGALLDEDEPESAPAPATAPEKPRFCGDYELLDQIGRGGMGVVYRARKPSLNKVFALKMLLHADTATAEELERLHIEAETAASIRHPNIVPVFDFGESDGRHYVAMELIEGQNLAQKITAKEFQMPPSRDAKARTRARELQREIARLVATVAHAVEHAHHCRFLHRDIKPSNILLDAKGQPYLTDFGLAKALDGAKSISESGAVMGTINYMSPEQADGKRVGFPTDVFSLGAVLYELLTGRPPFRGESIGETLRRLQETDPEHPRLLCHWIDTDLATICLKCLEKDPQRRYASAGDLAGDLDNWLANKPVRARPVRFFGRLKRWCRREPQIAAMAAGLFVLMAVVVLLVSTLLIWRETKIQELENENLRKRQALIERIAGSRDKAAPVPLSPDEVALVTPFEWLYDTNNIRITLSARMQSQQPDRMVPPFGHLVHCLHTSLWAQASIAPRFSLLLYPDEAGVKAALLTQDTSLFRVDPASFVIVRETVPGLIPVAQEALLKGTTRQRAAIIVHQDSNITNLAGLFGRKFAFGLKDSAIGWHCPRAALAAAGLRSRSLEWTNLSSTRVSSAVRLRHIDAGVVMWEDVTRAADAGQQVRVLWGLECPSSIWVAGPKWETNTRVLTALRRVFLALQDKGELSWLDYQLTGFLPVQPADYDDLQRQIETSKTFDAP